MDNKRKVGQLRHPYSRFHRPFQFAMYYGCIELSLKISIFHIQLCYCLQYIKYYVYIKSIHYYMYYLLQSGLLVRKK